MYKAILEEISEIRSLPIGSERKIILHHLIDYLQYKVSKNLPIRINFICTHNSRRSHLGQVWAQTLAYYFNIPQMSCYSGGTEMTALYPTIATTLETSGFHIHQISTESNPIYAIKFSDNEPPILVFSKKWDNPINPKSDFASVLTCSEADQACPYIAGAEKRIPITYEDPKVADLTVFEMEKYRDRSHQIAAEMYYVFSAIQTLN